MIDPDVVVNDPVTAPVEDDVPEEAVEVEDLVADDGPEDEEA